MESICRAGTPRGLDPVGFLPRHAVERFVSIPVKLFDKFQKWNSTLAFLRKLHQKEGFAFWFCGLVRP